MKLIVYTSCESLEKVESFFKENNITVTDFCPENGKSPWEQIDYIKDNCKKDLVIFTYSPYIINMLNLLIKQEGLTGDDLEAYEIFENTTMDLIINTEKGPLVDARSLSDPISWIYQEYYKITGKS